MKQDALKFVLLSILVASLGGVSLLVIIFLTSPYQKDIMLESGNTQINLLSIIGIYISFFAFFTGLFATIFFWLRDKLTAPKELYISATTSLRQGALMGVLICVLLSLQSFSMLIWWDMLLIILAVILVEMYLAVNIK
jgi:hypothetical protein